MCKRRKERALRSIDADKLMEQVTKKKPEAAKARWTEGFNDAIMRVRSMIHSAPTADVAEVRHGYNKNFDYPSLFECSVCGWSDDDTYTSDTSTYNFCPHCGAKMDGERREQ